MAGRARKRSRTGIGLAASVLVHLALVAMVMVSLPRTGPPPEPRGFEVTLTPLQVHPRARPGPVARASARSRIMRPLVPSLARPAEAAPLGPPPAQAPTSGVDQNGQAKLAALLRGSVGCAEADFLHLSQRERDRCNKWLQAHVDLDRVIPAPIAPEKRAWFDAAQAARTSTSHPPGFVCGMLIDGLRLVRPKAPPHALQLGSAPCFVIPPKWVLTQEADVETPSRQAGAGTALIYTPRQVITSDRGIPP